MKPLIALCFIPLLLTVFSACRNTDARLSSRDVSAITSEYERAIQDLAEGKDPQTVKTAIQVLSDAKTQAFPALIKHLSDKTPASGEYFGLRDILFRRLPPVPSPRTRPPHRPSYQASTVVGSGLVDRPLRHSNPSARWHLEILPENSVPLSSALRAVCQTIRKRF